MDIAPEIRDSAFSAFVRAVSFAGSQSAFARACGCTPGNIHQLLKKRRLLPGEHVLKAEAATGVSRHELRPDLYPPEPADPVAVGPSREELPPSPSGPAKAGGGAPVPHASGLRPPAGQGTCDRSATLHRQRGEALA
jgi:DNA-binding transcriptional regulator YdaS (Cro superfamily)